jgi:hypothetical protein
VRVTIYALGEAAMVSPRRSFGGSSGKEIAGKGGAAASYDRAKRRAGRCRPCPRPG